MKNNPFHMVRHEDIAAFERIGWRQLDILGDESFVIMEWHGEGEPVKPANQSKQGRAANGYRRQTIGVAR